ncbi:MAG: WG repeat-containing protein [Aridibacter sp.]
MKILTQLQKLGLFRSICLAVLIVMSCAVHSDGQDEVLIPIRKNGKMGFADKTGKVVISPQFDTFAESFSEGMISVKIGEKWGLYRQNRQDRHQAAVRQNFTI